ncbi:MAG: hypothetical protein H6622_17970 [Halobacteriovoraceae bacterium]|nr:hypothetical protein [Halobacteriovoraceae bacterium]
MNKQDWRNKVQEMFNTGLEEFKRTTEIGRKMINASRTNSDLHESYENLGKMVYKLIKSGELDLNSSKASELVEKISRCREDLKLMEVEMEKIKFASAPEDVSQKKENIEDDKK